MKLVGLGILGFVVSAIVYMLLLLFYDSYLSQMERWLGGGYGVAFLFLMPFSLILGGIFAGFFSCFVATTKWSLLLVAPGLYVLVLCAGVLIPSSAGMALYAALLALYWYVASLAGVGLGYFLSSQFLR